MIKYYSVFGKTITLEFENCSDLQINDIDFWIKKFTPSVVENKKGAINYFIHLKNCDDVYEVYENDSKTVLIGNVNGNESSIGKYISQVFQKVLIDDNIIFVHGACIALNEKGVIIMGDYGQGKTSVALGCSLKDRNISLLSDNYVAVKENKIIGLTPTISLRQSNIEMLSKLTSNKLFNHSNRVYYNYDPPKDSIYDITSIVIPHINSEDDNNYVVPADIARIYLYEKFSSLIKGETILFNVVPTESNANKENLKIILNEIELLMKNIELIYLSCSYDELVNNVVRRLGEHYEK